SRRPGVRRRTFANALGPKHLRATRSHAVRSPRPAGALAPVRNVPHRRNRLRRFSPRNSPRRPRSLLKMGSDRPRLGAAGTLRDPSLTLFSRAGIIELNTACEVV